MERIVFALLFCLSAILANAATVSGIVRAEAPPEMAAQGGGGGGAYASRKFKFVEMVDYSKIRNFIVFIDGPITNQTVSKPIQKKTVRVITQKDALFSPSVVPVEVGNSVEWPNYDSIFHNVFSISPGNEFDLGLYKTPGTNGWPKTIMNEPGRVDVFCSIHPKMNCTLLVLENPFFSSTDSLGRFAITNIPPGEYTFKAWHERLPARSQKVSVPATGEVKVEFILGPRSQPQK